MVSPIVTYGVGMKQSYGSKTTLKKGKKKSRFIKDSFGGETENFYIAEFEGSRRIARGSLLPLHQNQ